MGGEKQKRNGEALMKFEKQRKYANKQKMDEKKAEKKKTDRLRYLKKKEENNQMTKAEKKEKLELQNSVKK